MKYLALDYGLRRTGVAVGDDELGIALPRAAIATRDLLDELPALLTTERIDVVVVGQPTHPSGSESEHSLKVDEFLAQLTQLTSCTIIRADERYTTKLAQQGAHLMQRKRHQVRDELDSAAAALILQDFLERT